MPTTNYGWTYPTSASTVDVPRDIKSIADQVDATLKAQLLATIPIVVYTNTSISLTSESFKAIALTYSRAFPAGVNPIPYVNFTTNTGSFNLWIGRGVGLSLTGCTLNCAGPAAVTASGSLDVIAIRGATTPLQLSAARAADYEGLRRSTVICHNEGCTKNGEVVPDLYIVDQPNPEVRCGGCDTVITDIN